MNPGPVEEVGKTAGIFIDAMKSQPLALALVVMNLALLGLIWFTMTINNETRKREFEALQNEQKEVRELLSRCLVPRTEDKHDGPTSAGG